LVESGWKLSFGKENRLAKKLSHPDQQSRNTARKLAEFFSCHGHGLLPMVDLIEQSRLAVDELIDVAGRATIKAVLQLSAEQVAGRAALGRGAPGRSGRQAGRVCLKERKLGVTKPRPREKGGSEVAVPAYVAMQENGIRQRMLDVLMRGISTRQYAEVLPEMASTCGVSKSTVSRGAAEAGEEALKELLERRFDEIDLLVIYIDGMQFGEHHVISAAGVDRAGQGRKPCGRRFTKCLVLSIRWNDAAIIRFATCRTACLKSRRTGQSGGARQLLAGGEGRHGPITKAGRLAGAGIASGGEQFTRRGWRNVLRSTARAFHRRCITAWPRPT